jgi:integrase
MLAAGENVKVVQERLGHASITVTSDIYGHVIPGMHRETADRFAERLERQSREAMLTDG